MVAGSRGENEKMPGSLKCDEPVVVGHGRFTNILPCELDRISQLAPHPKINDLTRLPVNVEKVVVALSECVSLESWKAGVRHANYDCEQGKSGKQYCGNGCHRDEPRS